MALADSDGMMEWVAEIKYLTTDPKRQRANADLIAAAPDLLKAARLAVLNFRRLNAHPDVNFLGDDDHEAWTALSRAIAKAEGKH